MACGKNYRNALCHYQCYYGNGVHCWRKKYILMDGGKQSPFSVTGHGKLRKYIELRVTEVACRGQNLKSMIALFSKYVQFFRSSYWTHNKLKTKQVTRWQKVNKQENEWITGVHSVMNDKLTCMFCNVPALLTLIGIQSETICFLIHDQLIHQYTAK